jgi:hypothetical protein
MIEQRPARRIQCVRFIDFELSTFGYLLQLLLLLLRGVDGIIAELGFGRG